MTHKEAPPITPEQERFEKFWTELFRAWEAAQERSLVEDDTIFGAMSPVCVRESQQSTQRAREFWATYIEDPSLGTLGGNPMIRVDRYCGFTYSPPEASEGDK